MAGAALHRPSTPIWPQICPQDILGGGRCSGVGDTPTGRGHAAPLPGRLFLLQPSIGDNSFALVPTVGLARSVRETGGSRYHHHLSRNLYRLHKHGAKAPARKAVPLQEQSPVVVDTAQRQLESLLGHLNHAATVVRPGRTFTRHLIQAVRRLKHPQQRTRLDSDCMSDIAWWDTFIQGWNGRSLLPSKTSGPTITSDTSGSWGCGAFDHTSSQWFQYPWKEAWLPVNIAVKELLPIVISAALWGSKYKGCTVTFESDNQAVVSALTTRSVRHPICYAAYSSLRRTFSSVTGLPTSQAGSRCT